MNVTSLPASCCRTAAMELTSEITTSMTLTSVCAVRLCRR